MKKRSLWLCPLAIAAIVALDQWVKAYIVTHFAVGESKPFLPQLLRLHYVRNFGAAWSSFSGERWLLIGVTGVLLLIIGYLIFGKKITDETLLSGLSMILAGGLSNLIDRILRGYVVDCLDFTQLINFPVFNVADIYVTVAAVLLILCLLFYKEEDFERILPTKKKS